MTNAADRYYGDVASNYNAVRETSPRWRKEHELVRDYLSRCRGKTVLDAPVGTGRFVPVYKEFGLRFIGADKSDAMLAVAQQAAREVGYDGGRYVQADALAPYPKDMTSDVGVCMRFLNWLPRGSAAKAFRHLADVCREQIIVGLTAIDESQFSGEGREKIEARLAKAHDKPMGEGLPPNGPHGLLHFQSWVRDAGFEVAESRLVFEGKNHLANHVHRLVRRA